MYRFLTVVYFRGRSSFFVGTKRTYVRGHNIRDIWFWTTSVSVVNIRSGVVTINMTETGYIAADVNAIRMLTESWTRS